MTHNTVSSSVLQALCYEGEFAALVDAYQRLRSPTPEEEYWGALGLMCVGRNEEAVVILRRSLAGGYQDAAAPLAGFAIGDDEFEHARELLNSLGPFEDLTEPWARAFAYRERGQLFESDGRFALALSDFQAAWNTFRLIPSGQIALGFAGQLLVWVLELFGKSQDALEVVREAKKPAATKRRIRLLYLQVLTAARINKFDEAFCALADLETFVPNKPQLQGLASNAAGELARFQGHWVEAIEHFENTIIASSGAPTDGAFSACLFASHCSHALGDMGGAVAYLDRAAGELFSIDPFLAPAYAARAQANLALRRGAVDVALGKPTAIDHLENARQIFAELGLPLGQCLALLHLAAWYENERDREKAFELIERSEVFRTEIQDIGSYEAERVLLPQLNRHFERLEFGERQKQRAIERERARSLGVLELLDPPKGESSLSKDLRRLVIGKAYEEAISFFEHAENPCVISKGWAGLAQLLVSQPEEADKLWASNWDDLHRLEFEQLQVMAKIADKDLRYPLQLITVQGKTEAFLLRSVEGKTGAERLSFKNPQTAGLLVLLAQHHGTRDWDGLKFDQIRRVLWKNRSNEQASEEFESCCTEIDALGSRMPSTLPQFAVRQEGTYNSHRLVDLRDKDNYNGKARQDISVLPIVHFDFDALCFGSGLQSEFGQMVFVWAIAKGQISKLLSQTPVQCARFEGALLELGIRFVKDLREAKDPDAALLIAQMLRKIEAREPLGGVSPLKEELLELAAPFDEERYLNPGGIRVAATVAQEAKLLDRLDREMNAMGWRVKRLTSKALKHDAVAEHVRFDAEIDAILGIEPILIEEHLEIVCTKLLSEFDMQEEMAQITEKLSAHEASGIKFGFRL